MNGIVNIGDTRHIGDENVKDENEDNHCEEESTGEDQNTLLIVFEVKKKRRNGSRRSGLMVGRKEYLEQPHGEEASEEKDVGIEGEIEDIDEVGSVEGGDGVDARDHGGRVEQRVEEEDARELEEGGDEVVHKGRDDTKLEIEAPHEERDGDGGAVVGVLVGERDRGNEGDGEDGEESVAEVGDAGLVVREVVEGHVDDKRDNKREGGAHKDRILNRPDGGFEDGMRKQVIVVVFGENEREKHGEGEKEGKKQWLLQVCG